MFDATRVSALFATVLVAVMPATGLGQASGSYTLSGREVSIYNLAGIVEVVAGNGADVNVSISAAGADAGDLSVEVGDVDGRESLRVLYPGDRVVYADSERRSQTQLRVRPDGTFFGPGQRGRRVTVSGSGRGLEAWADMTISVPAGKSVSVNLGIGEVTASNIDGDLDISVAAAPVATASTSGGLWIDTGSGSVDVRGARGNVSIETGSGSIDVSGVTGGNLTVETGSGGVDGADLQVEHLSIETGSGSIQIENASFTNGRLDTGSGSVRLGLQSDVNDLDIETGSGGITVYHSRNLGAQLDLETGSGGIDFDVPVTISRFDRRSLRGSIGDGQGMIRVDTGSGSIRFVER